MSNGVTMFQANGVSIKTPDDLQYEYYSLSKSGRVASGKMTMDIIAQKHKLVCKYNSISSTEFQTMMNAIFVPSIPFYTLHYLKDNVWHDIVVYTGDIKKTFVRRGSEWYYKDMEVDFIEQ